MDIKPGLSFNVLSILWVLYLAHTTDFVCLLFVALCPYESMGIVAFLSQLPAIQQFSNRLGPVHYHCEEYMSISVMCLPMRVEIQYGLYPFVLKSSSSFEVDILVDSYWLL